MHFSSVSQCHSVAEGVQGVYSKVYSWSRGFKGGLQSTVEKSTVVSGIPFTVDCRAVDCRLWGVYSCSRGVKVYSKYTVVKGLPYTVDCRHWQKNTRAPGHVHVYMHVLGGCYCVVSLEKKKKVLRKIPLKQIQGVLAMRNR